MTTSNEFWEQILRRQNKTEKSNGSECASAELESRPKGQQNGITRTANIVDSIIWSTHCPDFGVARWTVWFRLQSLQIPSFGPEVDFSSSFVWIKPFPAVKNHQKGPGTNFQSKFPLSVSLGTPETLAKSPSQKKSKRIDRVLSLAVQKCHCSFGAIDVRVSGTF